MDSRWNWAFGRLRWARLRARHVGKNRPSLYHSLPVSLFLSPSMERKTAAPLSPFLPLPPCLPLALSINGERNLVSLPAFPQHSAAPPCWRPDEGDRRGGVERGTASWSHVCDFRGYLSSKVDTLFSELTFDWRQGGGAQRGGLEHRLGRRGVGGGRRGVWAGTTPCGTQKKHGS